MGYIFLFASALLNMSKSYGSKQISVRVSGFSDTVDVTVCRNFLCALIGAAILAFTGRSSFSMPPLGWLICLVAGAAIGFNYIVWVLSLKSGVYLLASASNSASFMIAAFCGIVFFDEKLTVSKSIAIILILLAMFFMGKYQTQTLGKPKPTHILLLLGVFLTAGVSSASQKWFTRYLPHLSAHVYTFYSLLISVVLLLIFTLCLPKHPPMQTRTKNIKDLFGWIALMSVCFYGATYFQTGASSMLDAVVMYPIYNGSLLVAGSLMAWLCFKEKPTRNSIIGAILVFAALLLMSL